MKRRILNSNFKNNDDAVEYVDKNIEDLLLNITNASEDVVRAYAEFKEFPVSIQAIDEDSYVSHENKIIAILSSISLCQAYLSEIEKQMTDYYKPEDYLSKRTEEIKTEIKSHLSDYVAEFSPDIEVKYSDSSLSDSLEHGFMIVDDGNIKSVKHFL